VDVDTPYGKPSSAISVGDCNGSRIAFLPRHGKDHTILPHKVPYKANLFALKSVGANHVIATCVVGSLQESIAPGTLVILDQFINFTWGRDDTSTVDSEVVHLGMSAPYCSHLSGIMERELELSGIPHRIGGTVVVIQGPRFSTVAESKMFMLWGGHVVNMTQYPECYFAHELGICYGAVASVTDYDVGVPSSLSMQPGNMEKVLAIFQSNTVNTLKLISRLAGHATELVTCNCAGTRIAEYYKARS